MITEHIPLVVGPASLAVAASTTVLGGGAVNDRQSLYFTAINSDVSQTFNGGVDVSPDNTNWYATSFQGLKGVGPGAQVAVRVEVLGHPYARVRGTASGAGLTLTNVYAEFQREVT